MRGVRLLGLQVRHGLLVEVLVGLREVDTRLHDLNSGNRSAGCRIYGHFVRMMLGNMVLQIGHLRIGLLAVIALEGLLARVLHAHVRLQICLLGKELIAVRALQRRKVLVLMIHDKTLLLLRNLLAAVRHATAPNAAIVDKREGKVLKRHRDVCVPAGASLGGSILWW